MQLKVLGKTSRHILEQCLPLYVPEENELWIFCDFAASDVPLGTIFSAVEDSFGNRHDIGTAELWFVTQGLLRSYDRVPLGHKTICVFRFHTGIPGIMQQLPVINDWYEATTHLRLC